MGKQINYWMEYETFLLLAQKALELGCVIYRSKADSNGKIVFGKDISVIIPEEYDYYFYFPEDGKISIEMRNGKEYVNRIGDAQQAIIEAGYSRICPNKKKITQNRLWCSTGFYAENDVFISRTEHLTKVYNSLARYVKKLAPYTELTDVYISRKDENYGEEVEYTHKEYVSPFCMEKKKEGYKLVATL